MTMNWVQLEEQNSQKWAWVDEFRNIEDEYVHT